MSPDGTKLLDNGHKVYEGPQAVNVSAYSIGGRLVGKGLTNIPLPLQSGFYIIVAGSFRTKIRI